jgi:hypothetical protein
MSWLRANRGDLDIGFDNALLYLGLSSSSSILFLTVAMLEAAFDMGLLSGEHLQSPKLRVSDPMLLPTGSQGRPVWASRSFPENLGINTRTSGGRI